MPKKITLNLVQVNEFLKEKRTTKEIGDILKISVETVRKFLKQHNLIPIRPLYKTSEEVKQKLSIKRREYLKNNPDKHPWRFQNKFKSAPCEKLKEWLTSRKISFVSEYVEHGILNRNFSIDIAIPDKKIAIEINGNQHYNQDGTLQSYYQERNDLLELQGWHVYQIHYSMCYNLKNLESLLMDIVSSPIKVKFDYTTYIKLPKIYYCIDCNIKVWRYSKRCSTCQKLYRKNNSPTQKISSIPIISTKNYCINCNIEINKNCKQCINCYTYSLRRVIRPRKECLHTLIWQYPMIHLGKMFSVSDTAIRKWCKNYNLTWPNNSYWTNLKKIIDYQI